MTSISQSVAGVDVHSAPRAKTRNASIDRTRTFLTLVVLLHHAVIPYTYFGHTDAKSFAGFDIIVLATDSFFMEMFFFLSGLFVWPGLGHKSPGTFLRDRLLRLGLPFASAGVYIPSLLYFGPSRGSSSDRSTCRPAACCFISVRAAGSSSDRSTCRPAACCTISHTS